MRERLFFDGDVTNPKIFMDGMKPAILADWRRGARLSRVDVTPIVSPLSLAVLKQISDGAVGGTRLLRVVSWSGTPLPLFKPHHYPLISQRGQISHWRRESSQRPRHD
jgi:hypothetical protein